MSENALEIVDLKSLTPVDLDKAKELVKTIQFGDSNSLTQYGVGAQTKISSFADQMLGQIRTKDSGEVGQMLTDLVFKVKDVDVSGFVSGAEGKGFFANLINRLGRFIAKYEKLSTQIEKIEDSLKGHGTNMMRDITMLDLFYQNNTEYLHNLDLYIAGGQIALKDLKEKTLVEMQTKAQTSGDPMDAQKLNDMIAFIGRLEKKLYDLKLSRMIAIQTAPSLRLIQNNDQSLLEKIQSAILTTIPLWKQQIVIAISLFRGKQAAGAVAAVGTATNDMLKKNSELLKQGTLEVAKETEKGIVEIETLVTTNNNLISTIEEAIKIHEEGAIKRAEAEKTLAQLEGELKAKLTAVRS